MKILIAYTHYPCSIGRYWKRGFQAAGHTVHGIGHYTGGDIPWPNGPWHLDEYADPPEYEVPIKLNRYNVRDQVYGLCSDYDVFINVDAAFYWQGAVPIPKVIIATDPHCINYDQQRTDCDIFVNMQNSYSKPGDYWVPYAHDPEWHYKADVPIDHLITHLGVEYDVRRRVLDYMATKWTVVRGTGILYEEGSKLYSAGHMALSLPSEQDLPTRFFEGMANGNVVLQKRIPELNMFDCKDGVHYIGFSNEEELYLAVENMIANPEYREEIKTNALAWVKDHTWQNRAEQVISLLK